MEQCIAEGQYRIRITDYSLREAKSGAVGIHIQAVITHTPDSEGSWEECEEEAVFGDVWVIKKDGTANDRAVESLMSYAGWDGNLESIACRTWHPSPCSCTTKREEHNGKVTYKIAFINAHDSTPRMSVSRAAELQAKYGSQLRRLGGADKPGVGSPMAPPPPVDGDIPF